MSAPSIIYPGVYVEEFETGVRTISGVSTATTAFLGAAAAGPLNRARHLSSLDEFVQTFGPLQSTLELGYAVLQFFANGGKDAWVVRIARRPTVAGIRKSLAALDQVEVLNLLALPGLSRLEWVETAHDYCRKRRAFFIADPPAKAATPAAMLHLLDSGLVPQDSQAALFYPWLTIPDPAGHGALRLSAPSGTVAGVFARSDDAHGIWKAPAGTGARLLGVVGLAAKVTDAENEALNGKAINCLRSMPRLGPVIWGSRTLAATDDSDYKYIPVRRLVLFIEQSIARGTRWAVFEPNDEPLWAEIRKRVEAFLFQLWRDGAFPGDKPTRAFYVRCDRTTMTQADIDAGRVIIEVGVAPLRPSEFVVVRIVCRS